MQQQQPKFVALFASLEVRSVHRETGEFEHVAVLAERRGASMEYVPGIVRTKRAMKSSEISEADLNDYRFFPKHGFSIQDLLHQRPLLEQMIALHAEHWKAAARANVEDMRQMSRVRRA